MATEVRPPVWLVELDVPGVTVQRDSREVLAGIREHNRATAAWTVVLDDDPTGSQTIKDVPIIGARPSDDELEWASRHPSQMTFVLTNSRAVDVATAESLTYAAVRAAAAVAARRGLRLRVVSRSDSTLRGHFAVEVRAAHRALADAGTPARGTVLVPAFLEAGRVTARDTQWVSVDGGFVPAAQTEYAADRTFGYDETSLVEWADTRLGSQLDAPTTSVSLESLRSRDGARQVAEILQDLDGTQVAVINAVRPEDLEVLMMAVTELERRGRSVVIRSGPSLVRLCAGQPDTEPLTADAFAPAAGHGLVVVGSHTELTNRQVEVARADHQLTVVDLDAAEVLADAGRCDREVRRVAAAALTALHDNDVLLRTSRDVLHEGRENPLAVSVAIGTALVRAARTIVESTPLGFLVAKGGITSSDLATDALGFRRAIVRGQLLRGTIPVWEVVEGRQTGLPYIVFPGNVGLPDALSTVIGKLTLGSEAVPPSRRSELQDREVLR